MQIKNIDVNSQTHSDNLHISKTGDQQVQKIPYLTFLNLYAQSKSLSSSQVQEEITSKHNDTENTFFYEIRTINYETDNHLKFIVTIYTETLYDSGSSVPIAFSMVSDPVITVISSDYSVLLNANTNSRINSETLIYANILGDLRLTSLQNKNAVSESYLIDESLPFTIFSD